MADGFLKIFEDQDFFEDLTTRHTKFQLENFVIGQDQGVTTWGRYKQVLRELNTRVRNLKESRYRIKKLDIKIRKLEKQLSETTDKLDKEDILLDIENEKYNAGLMNRDEEEVIREGEVLNNAYLHLKNEVNKELTDKTKDQLEEEYWVEKLKQDLQNS
ncbi:MAG: hypothetical protein ABUK01_17880, partial [Leptospirales bacterium]